MQLPAKQHPLEQVLPAQHGVPVWPQSRHEPADEQTVPASQRSAPLLAEQHDLPAVPQGEQLPLLHSRPGPQVAPQQGC